MKEYDKDITIKERATEYDQSGCISNFKGQN